jgi:type IV pilus assembly protein PilC
MPIIGILIRKVAVAKFTRTLGTLISSGVAILDGLDITARTAGNKIVEMAVLRTRLHRRGQDDRRAPGVSACSAPLVQMIAVGADGRRWTP